MRDFACPRWLAAFLMLFIANGTVVAQYVWIKDASNPVLSGGGAWTWDSHLFMPSVLFNPDSNRYEMWYGGSYGIPWRPYRIGFAWSTNGVTWTKHPGNPVLVPDSGSWDAYTAEGAFILRENGMYKMWYTGMRTSSGTWAIGYATSPNGINWTKWAGNPIMPAGSASWEAGGVGDPTIIKEGSTYTMFYDGANATQSILRIGRAVSSDGITWVRDTVNNPVLSPGASGEWDDQHVLQPQVYTITNRHYLWYTGYKRVSGIRRIGLASSADGGRTWSKERNAVLVPGPAGSWDADLVEAGRVMQVGGALHMWYGGVRSPSETHLWRIGHATAPVVGVEEAGGVPESYTLRQNYPNPFNPGTTIEYALPQRTSVTLSVYNPIGQRIAVLVQGERDAGSHEVQFDAEGLPSGVYFYRLVAGSFTGTRRMLLLR
jgi:predicted GH43/DUF377 family glycosyl hydrolase